MIFPNQTAFANPDSFRIASGQNHDPKTAFKDADGNVLFYQQTGGMISPQRAEFAKGTTIFRFSAGRGNAVSAMAGGWLVEGDEFERIIRFGKIQGISDAMAARILCGVPPEWSDMGLLVKVTLKEPLLAWRGLANSVIVPHPGGGPQVTMLHQNMNAQRRLYQSYIPGLSSNEKGQTISAKAFAFEGEWRFSAGEAMRGWIYI